MIIGIVGQPAAGKDTLAGFLEKQGFYHISTGDFLRQELTRQGGGSSDRQALHNFVTTMREQHGAGYPTTELLKSIAGKNTVLTGLRQIAEIEILRSQKDDQFILIAISAPIEKRFQWAHARKREGDNISFNEFKRQEDQERAGTAHQVDAVMASADILIENDGTIEDLGEKLRRALSSTGHPKRS